MLRGLGTLFIAAATFLFVYAYCEVQKAANASIHEISRFDTSKPVKLLTPEEQKERHYQLAINFLTDRVGQLQHDLQKREIINQTISQNWLPTMTAIGTTLVGLSFLVEGFARIKNGTPSSTGATNHENSDTAPGQDRSQCSAGTPDETGPG